MDAQNVLSAKNRSEFRSWLAENSQIASECWVTVKRGKPTDETEFWYIDAVEETLCFGWIEQMCEILSISTKTGYRILREGKILSLKVGRAYRIPKAHLFTYLCIGCGETVNA